MRQSKFKGIFNWNQLAPGGATLLPGPIRWAWVATVFAIGGPATTKTIQTGLQSVIWGFVSMANWAEVISTTAGGVTIAMIQGSYYTATSATAGILAFGY